MKKPYPDHWGGFLAEFNECWSHVDNVQLLVVFFIPVDKHVRTSDHLTISHNDDFLIYAMTRYRRQVTAKYAAIHIIIRIPHHTNHSYNT